jgi:hypothetical protein
MPYTMFDFFFISARSVVHCALSYPVLPASHCRWLRRLRAMRAQSITPRVVLSLVYATVWHQQPIATRVRSNSTARTLCVAQSWAARNRSCPTLLATRPATTPTSARRTRASTECARTWRWCATTVMPARCALSLPRLFPRFLGHERMYNPVLHVCRRSLHL